MAMRSNHRSLDRRARGLGPRRGRRDFRSNNGLEAAYYELHADLEVADEAKRILQQGRVRALQ